MARLSPLSPDAVDTTAGLEAPWRGLEETAGESARDRMAYLREVGDIPLLSREEQTQLAADLREATERFRTRVLAIPAAGAILVARWRSLRQAGRVTGTLSAGYRDGSGRDYSSQVDAGLSRAGALLARRERSVRGGRAADRRRGAALDAELAAALGSARLSTESIQRAFQELRARAGNRAGIAGARVALDEMLALKNRFVQHNLRLVVSVAKEFRNLGVEFVDLIQEANLGLVRAVEKFDERRGFTFSTYAVWWLRQACIRAVQQQSRAVRLPSNVYDLILRYRRVRGELERRLGRAPGMGELAEALQTDVESVESTLRWSRREESLQAPIPGSDSRSLEDTLADPALESPIARIDRDGIREELPAMLRLLDGRERRIVETYYGLGSREGATLEQIGSELGLSRERVRQIKAGALAKLRARAEQRGLRASLVPAGPLAGTA